MPVVEWNDSYSVGIPTFDVQHKKLFDLLDVMFEAMQKGQGVQAMGLVLGELKCYTVMHFGAEERLMEKYNFPGRTAHVFEHKSFIQKVEEITEKYKAGGIVFTSEITSFIKDWLVSHIQKMDKQYSDFFISRGEK